MTKTEIKNKAKEIIETDGLKEYNKVNGTTKIYNLVAKWWIEQIKKYTYHGCGDLDIEHFFFENDNSETTKETVLSKYSYNIDKIFPDMPNFYTDGYSGIATNINIINIDTELASDRFNNKEKNPFKNYNCDNSFKCTFTKNEIAEMKKHYNTKNNSDFYIFKTNNCVHGFNGKYLADMLTAFNTDTFYVTPDKELSYAYFINENEKYSAIGIVLPIRIGKNPYLNIDEKIQKIF